LPAATALEATLNRWRYPFALFADRAHRAPSDATAGASVLIHELTHAWVYHTGQPATLEDWCDLNGTILAAALHDLAAQGGVAVLEQLQPASK